MSVNAEEVEFEISPEAAEVIRRRGGKLWIWVREDGRPFGTTEPPGAHPAEWATHDHEGLIVRVDRAIVPPERWVIRVAAGKQRWLLAWWNGLDPSSPFGRVPLVREDEEPAEPVSTPLAHVGKFLVVPALAWILAVLWALRFAGVNGAWLGATRASVVAVTVVIGWLVWAREKLAERREDEEFAEQLAQDRLRRPARW